MKLLGKFWKLILALLLIGGAVYLYFDVYKTEEAAYQAEAKQLNNIITAMETNIRENMRYKDIQEQLEPAMEELKQSCLDLYRNFPSKLREEDQIMYALYLESIFGTEINLQTVMDVDPQLSSLVEPYTNFAFGDVQVLAALQDGANLQGLVVVVNYRTSYQGFQEMVDYLASDSRITSIYEATIDYNAAHDIAEGTLYLVLYMLDSPDLEYRAPDVAKPEVGKNNLFD